MEKSVNPRFEDFLFDWDYKTYFLFGGYGSSKSYHIALKIILKCLEEKRKVLVVREVYETIRESCFDLFVEILDSLDLLCEETRRKNRRKVSYKTSPMQFTFPNGSRIIFKGMDKPRKLKSINGVSIVWLEECSEIKYEGYKELLGRVRHPSLSLHFILSTNPVGEENWTYKHFFFDEESNRRVLNADKVYKKKTIVKHGVYYHHSLPEDNLFLPSSYVKQLDEMIEYDPDLYRVARLGRYGISGRRVLPQAQKMGHAEVLDAVSRIPENRHFCGMDFGFEESYNAIIRCAVDEDTKSLYVWYEYYKNKQTDPETSKDIQHLRNVLIRADSEDPKAIKYYNQSGFRMAPCHKFAGSRLSNTRKVKRFKHIYISDRCPNCWRELSKLTYKTDANGKVTYDEFNIDPHTFSAIWYALDKYEVPDLKERGRNSTKRMSKTA